MGEKQAVTFAPFFYISKLPKGHPNLYYNVVPSEAPRSSKKLSATESLPLYRVLYKHIWNEGQFCLDRINTSVVHCQMLFKLNYTNLY